MNIEWETICELSIPILTFDLSVLESYDGVGGRSLRDRRPRVLDKVKIQGVQREDREGDRALFISEDMLSTTRQGFHTTCCIYHMVSLNPQVSHGLL